jgi:hypothetical protein
MTGRHLRTRLLITLTRLFPTWWQQRYREEFTDLLRALLADGRRNTLSLALDIVIGALDAHLSLRPASPPTFPVLRRAAHTGLAVAALLAVDNVLANVVFPVSLNDNSPWGQVDSVVVFLGVVVLLVAIGAHGTRRSTTRHAGIKAGATAGFVIVTGIMVAWFGIDNLFLGTISQQPEKLITFATSGQVQTVVACDLGVRWGRIPCRASNAD